MGAPVALPRSRVVTSDQPLFQTRRYKVHLNEGPAGIAIFAPRDSNVFIRKAGKYRFKVGDKVALNLGGQNVWVRGEVTEVNVRFGRPLLSNANTSLQHARKRITVSLPRPPPGSDPHAQRPTAAVRALS